MIQVLVTLARLVHSLFRTRSIDVPSIDEFELPEKLFRHFPDPSKTLLEASLNEDVMEWQRYEISLQSAPRSPPEPVPTDLLVRLLDREEREWECVLPQSINTAARGTGLFASEKQVRRRKRSLRRWLEALEPLKKGKKPIVHKAGWWTYEFSYQRHLKQYHDFPASGEGKTAGLREEYLLGRYVPAQSVTQLDESGGRMLQTYLDGDVCRLPGGVTGPSRTTQVAFKCDPTAPLDYIEEVVEISVCAYLVTVASRRVCRALDTHRPDEGTITCFPLKALEVPVAFHPPPSDSENGASPDDRAQRKRAQHSDMRRLASDLKFPLFSVLVNDLLTEMGDLFEELEMSRPQPPAGGDGKDSDSEVDEADEDLLIGDLLE